MNPVVPNLRSSLCLYIFILAFAKDLFCYAQSDQTDDGSLLPTVLITVIARNKAHTLPYFFAYLERLNYPQDRISLWIRTDHSIDDTSNVLKTWVDAHQKDGYHSIHIKFDDSVESYPDESGPNDWSPSRVKHVIALKEEAIKSARMLWADYIFLLDCDVFLTNPNALKLLIEEKKTIIAPVLDSSGAYSNFWCGMTEQGYYLRTDDYLPILEREQIGVFAVPMVHSAVLLDLTKRESLNLSYDPKNIKNYTGPIDDIIVFAYSAARNGVKMHVSNVEPFGYMAAPLEKDATLRDDREQLVNLKVEMMVEESSLHVAESLRHFLAKVDADSLGFDQVYLINLERRPERKQRMVNSLSEMGIHAQTFTAVDGKLLNDSYLDDIGVQFLPGYADPYHKRPITKGEIGCFLSHYFIWKDMISKQHRTVLVLEDDLRFEPYFKKKIQNIFKEVRRLGLLYDLIYLGRKRLSETNEPYVRGTSNLVHVDYSYWTLAYALTIEGAKKLVSVNPLNKMLPVDEFLPIMFDRHPREEWKLQYPLRDLKAFSVYPLLVYPTHYTGEENYISDTEDSDVAAPLAKDEL